jgi:hypothetical protein
MLEWSDWRLGHDLLASEARTFQHDVQIIVLGFLEPGPEIPDRESRQSARSSVCDMQRIGQ